MHILGSYPDHYLAMIFCLLAVVVIMFTFIRCRRTAPWQETEKSAAALIITALMNILCLPVVKGIAIHMSGVLLLTLLIGPVRTILYHALLQVLLCITLQYGNIASIGLNIINISLMQTCCGYYIFRKFALPGPAMRIGRAVTSSSLLLAILVIIELSVTDYAVTGAVIFTIAVTGILVGFLEGLLTYRIYVFISASDTNTWAEYR